MNFDLGVLACSCSTKTFAYFIITLPIFQEFSMHSIPLTTHQLTHFHNLKKAPLAAHSESLFNKYGNQHDIYTHTVLTCSGYEIQVFCPNLLLAMVTA